jgi:hypothetical protein
MTIQNIEKGSRQKNGNLIFFVFEWASNFRRRDFERIMKDEFVG